jgi:hypothetical protein
VDAAFLDGGDSAPLVLSFDVPVTLGGITYEPADLVEYVGGVYNYFFQASSAGVSQTDNVTGADNRVTPITVQHILTFDVPAEVPPASAIFYMPGESVAWDPGPMLMTSFYLDPGWPLTSRLDALSLPADPGRVPVDTLKVSKAGSFPPDLDLLWGPSTSAGANDYAIYEGFLPIVGGAYSHSIFTCSTGGATNLTITPSLGDTYYLVVPLNDYDEGSYGLARLLPGPTFPERPPASPACRPFQAFGCP